MVANSCPCFLHVASRSLSNALFLPLAARRQMWPAVNTSGGTYMDALPRALEPWSMGGAQDKGGAHRQNRGSALVADGCVARNASKQRLPSVPDKLCW